MNAVGYLRLSTKDQSKSLEYQESIIREYCRRNKLKVLAVFRDNGESSSTFDRPDYIELEKFIKKHKGKCQYLIVLDHDRFSRNLPEALMKITELEKKHNVKVISTNEPIDLDTSDPDVFMKRAFDYLIANRELLTIRKRIRRGIQNAKENGRYIGKTPFGYENKRNLSTGSTIEVNHSRSFIISKIFQEYDLGIQPTVIHKEAIASGFKNKGNSAIRNVLENCIYAGLIKVAANKGNPEKYVKAIHTAIISETLYWRVQKRLSNKRNWQKRETQDFPLRGAIKCFCGKKMTAGWTKGKKKHYLYYKCADHPSINIIGDNIHKKMEILLRQLTLQKQQADQLFGLIAKYSAETIKDYALANKERSKSIKMLNKKNEQLEDKFITCSISNSTYKHWKGKFDNEKHMIESAFQDVVGAKIALKNVIRKFSYGRFNFCKIYKISTVVQKQMLLQVLFQDTLAWDSGKFSSSYFPCQIKFNLKKTILREVLSIVDADGATQNVPKSNLNPVIQLRKAIRIKDRGAPSLLDCHADVQLIETIARLTVKAMGHNGNNI